MPLARAASFWVGGWVGGCGIAMGCSTGLPNQVWYLYVTFGWVSYLRACQTLEGGIEMDHKTTYRAVRPGVALVQCGWAWHGNGLPDHI